MVNQNIKVCRASAGSGKTFALVSEYIARAIDSASGSPAFAPILAITFTNKATGEMKMRILNTLKSIAGGEARSDAYVGAIRGLMGGRISEEEIRRRCGATLAAILDNYDYFDVKTIDSFFQRIISDIAVMIGYETELQVFLGDDEAVDGAVDSLVSEAASGSNKTLTALIENYISLNAEDSDTWDFRKELKRFGTNVCQEIYMRNSARIDTTLGKLDTFTKIYKALSKERKTAADNIASLPAGLDIDYSLVYKGNTIQQYIARISDVDKYSAGKGIDPGSTVMKLINGDYGANPKTSLEQLTAWSDEMLEFEKKKNDYYKSFISADLTLRHLNEMRMLQAIDREVKRECREQGRILLSKSQELLSGQLRESGDISFVFERAGRRYRHIMLDEAQDTSTMQFDNLSKLIDNVTATGGNSCLIVGDVKQSIYRFRGGDWEILQKLGQKYDPDGRNTLHNNFRSEGNVVKFNNDLFAAIRDAYSGDYGDLYADVKQNIIKGRENRGYVDIRIYEKEGTAEEQRARQCEGLLESIRTAHDAGVRYADMAILCRSKADITTITDYLAVNTPEISITTEEAYNLTGSLAVQMIIAAIRYINGDATSNPDIISGYFLALEYSRMLSPDFTAPVFAAGDREAKAVKSFIHSHLPGELTRDGAFLVRLPIDELVMRLIRILRLGNLSSESQYIFTFVDYVNSYAALNGYDLQRFLDDWESEGPGQRISSGQEDSISAMTIHKAKGLEFHTVFIPFCDWKFVANNKANTMWCEPNGDASDKTPAVYSDIPLVPINFHKAAMNSIYAGDYQRESHNIMVDNLNYLYVALTRARCNLFVGYTHKAEAGPRSNPDAITSITAGRLMDRALSGSDLNPDEYKGEIIPSAPADNKKAEDTFSTEGELLNFPTSISNHA